MNKLHKMKYNSLLKQAEKLYAQREAGEHVDIGKEVRAHLDLAKFYDDHRYDKDLPEAEWQALECYRTAAILGDAESYFTVGRRLFEKARFWDELSRGMYGCRVHQEYYANYYKEALNYLQQAEQREVVAAQRLRAVAMLHGWGVSKDESAALDLLVASIEREDAWDRAKEIVEALGLDAPAFFSAIAARKGGPS